MCALGLSLPTRVHHHHYSDLFREEDKREWFVAREAVLFALSSSSEKCISFLPRKHITDNTIQSMISKPNAGTQLAAKLPRVCVHPSMPWLSP